MKIFHDRHHLRTHIRRRLVPVGNTRALTKAQMPENTATPSLKVRSDNFAVTIDDELVEPQPVNRLPMTQRYFLF